MIQKNAKVWVMLPTKGHNNCSLDGSVAVPISFLDYLLNTRAVDVDFISELRSTPFPKGCKIQEEYTQQFLHAWDEGYNCLYSFNEGVRMNDPCAMFAVESSSGGLPPRCVLLPTFNSALKWGDKENIPIDQKDIGWGGVTMLKNDRYFFTVDTATRFVFTIIGWSDDNFFDTTTHCKAAWDNIKYAVAMMKWNGIWDGSKLVSGQGGPYKVERSRENGDMEL